MKTFNSILTVLFVVLICAHGIHAQQTVLTPQCLGSNDTVAIHIPYKSNPAQRCALNTIKIPSNIRLDNTDGRSFTANSGQTATVQGPSVNQAILYSKQFAGANTGARIVAAIAALPSTGGTVLAADDAGTISQNMFAGVTKPITLILGSGTYIVTAQQTYATSTSTQGLKIFGAGMYATVIDNRVANGAAFSLNGSGAPDVYQRGSEIRDLSIVTTTSPASSRGIDLHSQMHPTITRVRIEGLTSHGIQLLNDNGDHDATAYLTMTNCELFNNGGYGFYSANPAVNNASGNFIFLNNVIVRNGGGGIRAIGLQWTLMGGSITYNTGYGLYVPYTVGSVSQTFTTLHVFDVEMDGNTTSHVFLEAAVSATFDRIKAITSEGHKPGTFTPAVAFKIGVNGGKGSVIATKLNSILLRRDGGTVTLFQVANNAHYTSINEFTRNTPTGVTDYTDAGTGTRIIQNGQTYGAASSTINSTRVVGSYTPNAKIEVHRIVITGAGAFAMSAPTGAEDGREIELLITNASSGAITITFNAAYFTAGYVDPASGQRTSAKFRYIAAAGNWIQVGAWSPPA